MLLLDDGLGKAVARALIFYTLLFQAPCLLLAVSAVVRGALIWKFLLANSRTNFNCFTSNICTLLLFLSGFLIFRRRTLRYRGLKCYLTTSILFRGFFLFDRFHDCTLRDFCSDKVFLFFDGREIFRRLPTFSSRLFLVLFCSSALFFSTLFMRKMRLFKGLNESSWLYLLFGACLSPFE